MVKYTHPPPKLPVGVYTNVSQLEPGLMVKLPPKGEKVPVDEDITALTGLQPLLMHSDRFHWQQPVFGGLQGVL